MSYLNEILPALWSILFFCGSIVVHELGHYVAAKVRGLYVPRFSIGFGPKLISKKFGKTEFRLSLLPFGGYVAIPQLADLKEVEGKFSLPPGLKKVTFTDKIIVLVMGAAANIIFAILLSIVLWYTGIPMDSGALSQTIGYIDHELALDNGQIVPSPAKLAGLEIGDEILAIDGTRVTNFSEIQQALALGTTKNDSNQAQSTIKFRRGGEIYNVVVYPILCGATSYDKFRTIGILPKQELFVNEICAYSDAIKNNNIRIGDRILSVDSADVLHIRSLREMIFGKNDVQIKLLRDNKIVSTKVKTIHKATTKPFISLSFSSGSIDIIPYYYDNVDATKISEKTDSHLLIFFRHKGNLENYNLSDGLEISHANGKKCDSLFDLRESIKMGSGNTLIAMRSGSSLDIAIPPISAIQLSPIKSDYLLGIKFCDSITIIHRSPIDQIKGVVTTTFKTLRGLFSHHSDVSVKSLMGPTGLVRTLHIFSRTDFRLLLWFVILINVNLAILNMLPLPILDGGVVAMSIFEKLTGSKLISKIFNGLQCVFFVLVISLLVYVSFFDIRRWIADGDARNKYAKHERLAIR